METVRIAMGRSGRVWPAVLQAAAEGRETGRRVILYVPEQMTLQAERDLIADLRLNGLIDIEVISPRKLRTMVRERTGGSDHRTLDEAAQVMAVHRAMAEKAENLDFYRNMTELPGAVARVREALLELRDSDITPEETEKYAAKAATGSVQAKLRDLNLIREAYETLVADRFEDEKRAWTEMVNRLGRTDIFRNADLLVYGFDTVRPDLRELLCKAAGLARYVCVFLTADTEDAADAMIFGEQHRSVRQLRKALADAGTEAAVCKTAPQRASAEEGDGSPMSPMIAWLDGNLFAEDGGKPYPASADGSLTLYAAADRADEAEQAAACLLAWHAEGIPWEKMAVALPSNSRLEGLLRARLRLGGIPFCSTEEIPAASHGVCRMLCAALECISGGYTTENVTEAALSGFTTLTEEEALACVNYAEAHGIEGSRWRKPFLKGEGAEAAEAARQKLTAPIEALRGDLKNAESADGSVEAIVRFLEAEGVPERLEEREKALLDAGLFREAVADRQVWKLLTELLDRLWTLLGKRRAPIRDLKNMLQSALGTAAIATLPETESGVMLGGIGHMLPGHTDALVLPGFQEGVMTAPASGWLTDREREGFEQGTGKEIGISRERRGWIRRYDFYRTMTTPRKYLRISWSLRDENGSPLQEDGLLSGIRAIFPGIREEGGITAARRTPALRTPLEALESMGSLLDSLRKGKRDAQAERAVVALLHSGVYGRTARAIIGSERGEQGVPRLGPETAARLFRTDVVSISRLERFAACPYQHFIDYGLRPVQQETYDFDDAEAGTFFHAALDRFLKAAGGEREWPYLDDLRVDGIMDGICAELTQEWEESPLREDALGIWQGEEYLRRVRHAARVLARFARNSDFRTIATEQAFGKTGGLPPLRLRLADGSSVQVQGVIDRIDTYENGEGVWLRVVDNKSREKKPDPSKMEDGEQLQLMIYLKAAEQAYPHTHAAGALFFPVQDAEVPGADETPEALEAERLKKVRMKGLVNAREDVLRAMDRDIRPYSLDDVFKKDGTVRKGADWAVEESVLHGLMAAAEEKAAEIAGEIRQGRIEAAPRGTEEDSPCRYCGYRVLCHRRKEFLRPRSTDVTYTDIARSAGPGKNTLREAGK